MLDIYNALLGIIVLAGLFFLLMPKNVIFVAAFYLCATIASGIVSTIFYKDGWDYLNLLKSK